MRREDTIYPSGLTLHVVSNTRPRVKTHWTN